jgi:beta-phosphoglucomutase-like phosphatase (HAD superfamily)
VAINHRRHETDAAETGALCHDASIHCVHQVAVRWILGRVVTLHPCSIEGERPMPEAVVFDVNETLLNLATLTNSTAKVAEAQLTHAGLIDFFEQVLSVDAVRQFKPATGAYRMAARELGVRASDLRLVAAHDWDVAGALRAGWAAAFVARPGMVLGPLGERPDIVGRDLREVVDQVLGE